MIQVLDQPRMTRLPKQTLLDLASNGPTISGSSTFCPQITTLSWTAFDANQVYAAKLFTSRSLKFLRLTLGDYMVNDSNAFDVLLEHATVTSPSLETLEIVSSTSGTLSITLNPTSLTALSNLHSVNLHVALNNAPLLKCLSNLPRLHTLRGHISSQRVALPVVTRSTFKSLHTFGLTGGRTPLVNLFNMMAIPRLAILDINVDDVTGDADFSQLCHDLSRRVKGISRAQLFLTHRSSAVDITSALKFCIPMARELVIRSNTLSFSTFDSSSVPAKTERLTLLATTGWKQAFALPKLLNLLRNFPSLKYLEIGIDANGFQCPSLGPNPHNFPLETLAIYPGPIQTAWPVASFISSILPSTQINVQGVTGRTVVWDEVAGAIPELQRSVLVERRARTLEQEVRVPRNIVERFDRNRSSTLD